MQNNDDGSIPLLNFFPQDNIKSIKSYKQIVPVTIYHFYITDEMEDVEPYLELINTLKTAEAHDTIFIYLNTPGGDLQTAIQIIAAINQSHATVVTSLEGQVCSAGTLIFLSGHKFMVNNNCTFMIHNYSSWSAGKGNEIALQVKYQEGYFKKLAEDIYGGFLTTAEIDDMLQGKDFWLDSESVIARLKLDKKETDVDAEATFVKAKNEKKKPKKH